MDYKAKGGRRKAERRSRSHGMRVAFRLLFTSSFILHPSAQVWAAHPLVTDDSGTQGAGGWQLELQGEFFRSERTANAGAGPVQQRSELNALTSVLSYGVLENLDVQVGLTRLSQRTTENGIVAMDASGMSDSTVEVKWRFYDADGLGLALKPGLQLPTGDEMRGLGTGRTSWGVAFLATYEAGPWTLLGNLAYDRARFKLPQDVAGNRSDLWRASGGFAYALTGEVRLVGEAGIRTNEARSDPFLPGRNGQFAMAGVIFSPTRKTDFDAGFRRGLNRAEPDKAFLAGASFRW